MNGVDSSGHTGLIDGRSSNGRLTPTDLPSWLECGRASDGPPMPSLTLPRMITTPDSKVTGGIPVFVMLPLDTVSSEGVLRNPRALEVGLKALRAAGVTGVMVDVWWGVVERAGPKAYDWSAYQDLLRRTEGAGLQLQAVMSFHACGGNVGDDVSVSLPPWVHEAGSIDPDIFYTDQSGHRNRECISLFADTEPCLAGRTPIQVYTDFISAFKHAIGRDLGHTVTEVAIGMGPCGELRYPSYPEGDGRWRFPGVGEFQCYDRRALLSLRRAAEGRGHPLWGLEGPHDAGHYNSHPEHTGFFHSHGGSWQTEYGTFFLEWYSQELIRHGERMLTAAREALRLPLPDSPSSPSPSPSPSASPSPSPSPSPPSSTSSGPADPPPSSPKLSLKCAGIHWWYRSSSHGAELTAGYNNPRGRNGYEAVAQLCQRHDAHLTFTCVEMRNAEQPGEARCGPQELLNQVRVCAAEAGVPLMGENALARLDQEAYDQMVANASSTSVTLMEMDGWGGGRHVSHRVPKLEAITFLRLTSQLFEERNFDRFSRFVKRMREGEGRRGQFS